MKTPTVIVSILDGVLTFDHTAPVNVIVVNYDDIDDFIQDMEPATNAISVYKAKDYDHIQNINESIPEKLDELSLGFDKEVIDEIKNKLTSIDDELY